MNDPDRIDPLALIGKLAQKEKELAEKTFLAPVTAGGKVRVAVDGIVYEMTIDDRRFEGWGVFKMSRPGHAKLLERASLSLVSEYLKLFPRKQFVLIDKFDKHWFALAASNSDTRFTLDLPVPILLLDEAKTSTFDTINCRFDGAAFWFEGADRRRDPAVARTLRQALESKTDPDNVHCRGMTPQELLAYKILYLRRYHVELPPDDRSRIAEALRHAGATLDSFSYDSDHQTTATVRFVMGDRVHVVNIATSDMSLVSAGVCLSGKENDFDLTSVVTVLKEADRRFGDYEDW